MGVVEDGPREFSPDWELREVACALAFAEKLERAIREGDSQVALDMTDHIKVFLETVRHDRRTAVAIGEVN